MKTSVELPSKDRNHYLLVINHTLNAGDAQDFCHDQFGGQLIYHNQTNDVLFDMRILIAGQLTTDVSKFWLGQELMSNGKYFVSL